MIVPYATTQPVVGAIIVAGIVAVLANGLPHKLGLMVAAIAGVVAGFTLETQLAPRPKAKG
jgi:outer membrane lipoprotein SlyB